LDDSTQRVRKTGIAHLLLPNQKGTGTEVEYELYSVRESKTKIWVRSFAKCIQEGSRARLREQWSSQKGGVTRFLTVYCGLLGGKRNAKRKRKDPAMGGLSHSEQKKGFGKRRDTHSNATSNSQYCANQRESQLLGSMSKGESRTIKRRGTDGKSC